MTLRQTGVALIAEAREHQKSGHGFDAQRDDRYVHGELACAAIHHAIPAGTPEYLDQWWPAGWDAHFDQRDTDTRIEQLAKAGALIAAEIDRLVRRSPFVEASTSLSESIMRWFENKNLPPHLQEVVAPWKALAEATIARSGPGPERSTALRKLLEGKDAAVRAVIEHDEKDEKNDEKTVFASGGAPLNDEPKRLSNFMGIAGDQSRDPRRTTHQYVQVLDRQGCGVCGFGIGAAVHNGAGIEDPCRT